ncbi:hypothetical protein BDR26DRAFT_1008668 [Obelidium mucronatum]|nr:hypothetical protein BDR26DRAFT_1008668 [Obelidium mucronatum]
MQSPTLPLPDTLPSLRVSNNPNRLSIQFSFDEIKNGLWKQAPYKTKDDKKTIFILWSDLREVTEEVCPDLHTRVVETKGSPKELVEEATEALDKIYINSNNTLKLVFLDKTKCTVHIPGLKNKTLTEVYKWIKDTNQDLTVLGDLCFSGIVDLDGNWSENDEERAAALAKYIYARKVSNNKFHVVFAPTPTDTNATKITRKATARAARQQAATEGGSDTDPDIPPISQLPGSAAENERRRAIKSTVTLPALGSDDPIGLAPKMNHRNLRSCPPLLVKHLQNHTNIQEEHN